MLLNLFTGEETLRAGTCSIYAFYRPQSTAAEIPFYRAANDPRSGIEKISAEFIQASPDNRNNGQWFQTSYQIAHIGYVRIWMRRRQSRASTSFGYQQAVVMLRLREEAAFRRIRFELVGEGALSYGYSEGNFDVIDLGDFKDAGVSEQEAWSDYADSVYWDDMFTIDDLRKASAPFRPQRVRTIETEEGGTITLPKRKGRKIKMRKR